MLVGDEPNDDVGLSSEQRGRMPVKDFPRSLTIEVGPFCRHVRVYFKTVTLFD